MREWWIYSEKKPEDEEVILVYQNEQRRIEKKIKKKAGGRKREMLKEDAVSAPSAAICVWMCEAGSSTPVRDYWETGVFSSPEATWAAKQVLSPDN